jgi:hypothetical protein
MNYSLKETLENVISYLEKQGVIVDYNELHNHIMTSQPKNEKPKKKRTFKVAPKQNTLPKENEQKPKKIKFKPKPKPKLKGKQDDYQRFVDICNQHNLYYFQFNDEFNWKGPTIKIDIDNFNLSIFGDLEIHILEGFGFGILRPKNHESDKKISYNEINYNHCKLMDEDILSVNGSDAESDNVYDNDTEYDDEEVVTVDWTYIPDNVIYQLDIKTNNIYCNQTNQYVGKKIDDFNIDYDSKEHEGITLESA